MVELKPINSKGMLVFAILGIFINGIAVLRLKKGTSINEKVVSWHLLEDVLGWMAILIVSIVLLIADIPVLDPILSILISVVVLYNVIKNLRQILNIFLQGVPKDLSIKEIEQEITGKTGAISAYHTHLWSLEGEKNLLSTHIIVKDGIAHQEIIAIKQEIRRLMKEKGIDHVTIEVDYQDEGCENKSCD